MARSDPDKQAVVIIHGMGEQQAMDTLRGFAQVVWSDDDSLRPPGKASTAWNKPDQISDALELRRLTTVHNRDDVRTDFFEFYWAHLLTGTRISHVLAWVKLLLFRRRRDVPDRLYAAWILLWVLSGLVALLVIDLTLPEGSKFLGLSPAWTAVIGVILALLNAQLIAPVIGDAARYLSAAPENVAQRRAIRDEGATLLRKLIDSGEYRRIVIVGHSLGSIIGYDILRDVWADYNTRIDGRGPGDALDRLQALANARPLDRDAYRAAQRDYVEELKANGNPWCVTDFVTMGSPLAHGRALMARSFDEFDMKVREREYPVCPPLNEELAGVARFTYDRPIAGRAADGGGDGGPAQVAVPHHAAVFAPVRWTNLYFPCRNLVEGDFIAGPIAPVFGPGVEDVAVESDLQKGYFQHTLYWTPEDEPDAPNEHVRALRRAVQLLEGRPRRADEVAAREAPPAPRPAAAKASAAARRTTTARKRAPRKPPPATDA